jgi:hypothetical protein
MLDLAISICMMHGCATYSYLKKIQMEWYSVLYSVKDNAGHEGGKTVNFVFKYLSRSLLWKGVGAGGITRPPLTPHPISQRSVGISFKGTVRPDWICMRVLSLESPLKGHKPAGT